MKEAYPETVPGSFHFESVSFLKKKSEIYIRKSLPHLGPFP